MPTVALRLLKPHPAQMRTTYDLESLATLTLQLFERGLDNWQPIVASPDGQATQDSITGYHIISGHRRHMAQLLAFALRDWARERPEVEVDIEASRTMLATLGPLEKAMDSLLARYGDEEIEFVLFEGSPKAQILALQSANYGSEKPDALGIAHSFREAIAAGATPEEMARNAGQHLNYVLNHLALAEIPPELAQRIAASELPMSVAVTVADLPEPKRTGLAIFILANPSTSSGQAGKLTAKAIKDCAVTLKKWPGLQLPLMAKHQSQRNIARALVRLWSQVVEAYPEDAYATAAMLIYRDLHEDPWTNSDKLTLWFQALGGDTYFRGGAINWTAVVEYLLSEVACETCPIAQLPKKPLRSDLSQGQGGPLGMPCRVGETTTSAASTPLSRSGQASRCLHGLAANDSFDVRVPWEWSEHPGVISEGGDYRIKSYEGLLAAWQTQAAKEKVEDEAAATTTTNDEQPPGEEIPSPSRAKRPSTTTSPQPDETNALATLAKDSPIVKQRAQIANFIQRHEQLAANHPFATPCGRCQHRLEASPTKDNSVPHCAWAGRLRSVSFKQLIPGPEDALHIPVCRQFAPNQPWYELIPGHPHPPVMPREWLKEQILHLVQDVNRRSSDQKAFEFLTGRPMGANENYGDWFSQQLEAQGGNLSDAQLFTLFVWAHSEWQRARSSHFSLPVNGHGVQFATCREREWTVMSDE